MKKAAIAHAQKRLERARASVARMERAKSYVQFEEAWSDFLSAHHSIFEKLHKGSKASGSSQGWFGRKKHDRKHDPLLSYLHHARNSDQHGIEDISSQQSIMELEITGYVEDLVIDEIGHGRSSLEPGTYPGFTASVEHYVALMTVVDDRFGDRFDPPKEHLGQPLPGYEPLTVAKLGLAYIEQLIAEAETLPAVP